VREVPTFMDRHDDVDATEADVADLHALDIATQAKHGVQYLSYWFEPEAKAVFCFVDAPSREAAEAVHAEAHGQVANSIIPVEGRAVMGFLGPEAPDPDANNGSGFRTILFTDIVDSTRLTQQLGDVAAMELVHTHDNVVRTALATKNGSEVKHTGDGIMASFADVHDAIDSAVLIQRALDEHAREAEYPIKLRIGISAGEPVTEHNDLFGSAVQLAARACAIADVGAIFVSDEVADRLNRQTIEVTARGPFDLKGFDEPVALHEVNWRSG
jgi:class 3 adenylate cyclase